MLNKNFFNIINKKEISENEIVTNISLNKKHKIFDGHFPNNPVVPGVVSLQMVNEILSEHISEKLLISKARNIKFANMINPNVNPKLTVNIKYSYKEEKSIKVNANISFEETMFFKFNGIFAMI